MHQAGNIILEVVEMAVNALFFMFTVFTIIYLVKSGTYMSSEVQDSISSNETVVTSYIDADYIGYVVDGVERYDGVLSGAQVYSDILYEEIDNVTLQINGAMVNLNTRAYGSTTYLNHVRTSEPALLKNDISFDVDYIRKYMTDENGKIVSVVYEKKQ